MVLEKAMGKMQTSTYHQKKLSYLNKRHGKDQQKTMVNTEVNDTVAALTFV